MRAPGRQDGEVELSWSWPQGRPSDWPAVPGDGGPRRSAEAASQLWGWCRAVALTDDWHRCLGPSAMGLGRVLVVAPGVGLDRGTGRTARMRTGASAMAWELCRCVACSSSSGDSWAWACEDIRSAQRSGRGRAQEPRGWGEEHTAEAWPNRKRRLVGYASGWAMDAVDGSTWWMWSATFNGWHRCGCAGCAGTGGPCRQRAHWQARLAMRTMLGMEANPGTDQGPRPEWAPDRDGFQDWQRSLDPPDLSAVQRAQSWRRSISLSDSNALRNGRSGQNLLGSPGSNALQNGPAGQNPPDSNAFQNGQNAQRSLVPPDSNVPQNGLGPWLRSLPALVSDWAFDADPRPR